jgi:hypothetical protein
MKTKLLLSFVALMAVSCAKKEFAANAVSSATQVPVVDIPTDGSTYVPDQTGVGYDDGDIYGSTASFQVTSLNVMSEYTGRPMNNPQQIEVNLNLAKYGDSTGGTVRISYSDNGYRYEGYFTAGHSEAESQYNKWFTKSGKKVWHGFFEDYLGAIVVVIDGVTDLGDGGTADQTATGSVWFKNFGYTYAPRPPAWCWFVSLGPYDCRAWKDGNGVATTRSVNPDNGYKKLGTFSGLDLNGAFNGDL